MAISSFATSTMGMNAQTHALEQISSNIANVNTTGYKKVEARFETLLSVYNDNGSSFSSFSANNVDRRMVDVSGFLTTTNSIYDLGINGQGFFVVEGDKQTLYSRAGDFRGTAVAPAGYQAKEVSYYKPTSNGVVTQSSPASYLTNSSGYYVMGWNYNSETEAFSSSLEPVIITPMEYYPGHETTKMSFKGNIDSTATSPQQLKFPIYDNSYQQHNLTLTWEPQHDANTWILKVGVEGATVTGDDITVRFNADGQMVKPVTAQNIQIAWNGGSNSTVSFDLTHFTQYAHSLNGEVLSQDGESFGTLINKSWDADGTLNAYYSNSAKIPVCKVAVAQVQVPNRMEAVSGNMFAYTPDAGNLEILDLQKDLTESFVEGGKLEGSNVALEDEFTNMIVTQRAYSSNVQVFTTVNEMSQEAIGILS